MPWPLQNEPSELIETKELDKLECAKDYSRNSAKCVIYSETCLLSVWSINIQSEQFKSST